MIDPNAPRRPGKMNIGKMLDYVRANPMSLADGSLKRTMRGGGPPLQPMMMARAEGGSSPAAGVASTSGPAAAPGGMFGGGRDTGWAGFDPHGPNSAWGNGLDASAVNEIGFKDDGIGYGNITGMNVGSFPGYTPTNPVAPMNPAVAATVGKRGFDDVRGIAPGMGVGVNAAGQAMGGPAPGSDPFGYGGFANEGYGSHGYGVNPQTAAHEAAASAQGNYGSSSGAGAAGTDTGGKIVCTAMNEDYGFGSFRQAIWLRHSAGLHPAYERGYHAMFRPLLAYGRKRSTLAQRAVMAALEDIARMRTFDIRREARAGFWRGLTRGRLYRAVLEPLCFVVGLFNAGR